MKCLAQTFYLLNSTNKSPDKELGLKFRKVFILIKYSVQFYSLKACDYTFCLIALSSITSMYTISAMRL